MSHYKETVQYDHVDEEQEHSFKHLYADWNSKTNTVTVWNKEGIVIYSGYDDEAKALGCLLSNIRCQKSINFHMKIKKFKICNSLKHVKN